MKSDRNVRISVLRGGKQCCTALVPNLIKLKEKGGRRGASKFEVLMLFIGGQLGNAGEYWIGSAWSTGGEMSLAPR